MAPREVEVFVQIGGEDVPAGRLWPHRRQQAESQTFAYSPSYLARNDAYPLEPALPLVAGQIQTPLGHAMFGAFSDCAPNRWGRMLIHRRARRAHEGSRGSAEESVGEIDYLLGVRDDLRQGALRFRAAGTETFLADETAGVPHLVDLPQLLGFADRAERDVADEEELDVLLRRGSSLGGARPKAHVLDRSGRIAIAKFPRPQGDEWDVTAWEAVALQLARDAGIAVADSELIEVDGRSVLVVDRFDRDGERRIAFSRLIANTDDHLRNHGFLRATTSGWALSPAFDLNPNPEPGAKRFATAIDDGSGDDGLETLLEVAGFFRLNGDEARAILAAVGTATSRWREVARKLGIAPASIAQLEPAFETPAADLAREMAAGMGEAGFEPA